MQNPTKKVVPLRRPIAASWRPMPHFETVSIVSETVCSSHTRATPSKPL
jgi:hypothetical protein